jgi:hypothetical protein
VNVGLCLRFYSPFLATKTYCYTYKELKVAKKLTITVDSEVYDGLHTIIGPGRISQFLNDLARPHVVGRDLSAGYSDLAADEAREAEAEGWSEGLLGDVTNEPKRA